MVHQSFCCSENAYTSEEFSLGNQFRRQVSLRAWWRMSLLTERRLRFPPREWYGVPLSSTSYIRITSACAQATIARLCPILCLSLW